MKKIDFLIKKYEFVYDLFKLDTRDIHTRNQIFTAVQGGFFLVLYYFIKEELFEIGAGLSFVAFLLSLLWSAVNRKAHLFAELRKQFLRDVEYEIDKEEFHLDIFKIDQEVFGPLPQVPKKWNFNKKDEFPPEKFKKDFEKFKGSPMRKYEKKTPLLFVISWLVIFLGIILTLLWQWHPNFVPVFTQIKSAQLVTLLGLSLNFVGAIMIAIFSEHGTSKGWQHKKLKMTGYILFICGFGIHIIIALLNMFN